MTEVLNTRFHQSMLINIIDRDKHKKCFRINAKYSGLCDILCNYATAYNFLESKEKVKSMLHTINSETKLVLNELENKLCDSHILKITSLIEKILAFLFKIYPCNILSYSEQLKILDHSNGQLRLNKKIFIENFNKLNSGDHIKFSIFNGLTFAGHTMLFSKFKSNEEEGAFFDPNGKTVIFHTINELIGIIDEQLNYYNRNYGFNQIYFINNAKLLDRVSSQINQVSPQIEVTSLANRSNECNL